MGLRGIGGSPWIPKYNLSCAIPPLTSSSLPTSNILVTVGWTPTESFSLAHHCLPPSGSIRSLEEQLPWPALLVPPIQLKCLALWPILFCFYKSIMNLLPAPASHPHNFCSHQERTPQWHQALWAWSSSARSQRSPWALKGAFLSLRERQEAACSGEGFCT